MDVRDSSLEAYVDSNFKGFPRVGSKAWANRQLRFSIRILKGEIVRSTWKGRLQIVLYVKDRLLEQGYTWQATRIDNWIHRLQPRKADLSKREREGASF